MRKNLKIILLFIILVATMNFTACSKKARNEIIGKWEVVSFKSDTGGAQDMLTQLQTMAGKMIFTEGSIVEFIDGGKVSLRNVVTEYSWVTEEKIQIGNENSGDAPLIFDVSINDDTMVFENEMVITFKKADGKSGKDDKEVSGNNERYDELQMQIDSLSRERDELMNQKSELEKKVQALESELQKYQEVVHKREFITQDSQIEEKFATAYSIEETATVKELEISLSNVTFSDNYKGVIPEFGKIVAGTINIKNIGLDSAVLGRYTMYVVDKEGHKFKKSVFNNYTYEFYEPGNTTISEQNELKPVFSISEEFMFIVPDTDTELLLEIVYNDIYPDKNEVKYIRLR